MVAIPFFLTGREQAGVALCCAGDVLNGIRVVP